jgi:hypothetical protein
MDSVLTPQKTRRRWLKWTVLVIWVVTFLAVLIADHIHPATTVEVSLTVREFSFRTNASHILGPSEEEQLLVSGLASMQIQLSSPQIVTTGGSPFQATSIQIEGEPSASCTFYRVRSSGLDLNGPSILTLGAPNASGNRSFSMKVHGAVSGRLTSRKIESVLKSGFQCTRVHTNGGSVGSVEVSLSPQGGDSIFFATAPDAQLGFDLTVQSEIGDTQIPITDEVRFSHIDPRTLEEKTVLLKNKNKVTFEKLGKSVPLDEADLLVVTPKNEFYLTQFTVKDGVDLNLHGVASDVRAGAGATDLATLMPSSLDHLDNMKRIYALVPSIVGVILGILEKMGLLPKK